MKRKFIAALLTAFLAAAPVAAQAAESSQPEVLARVDASDGACGLFGAMAYNENLFLLMAYQNNGSRENCPAAAFNVKAFQDGVALQMAVTLDKPEGFESSATFVQPGTTIPYYQAFKLRSESPVEVQFSAMLDLTGSNVAAYTFNYADLNGGEAPETESADSVNWEEKYYELLKEYQALEEKYNSLVEAK